MAGENETDYPDNFFTDDVAIVAPGGLYWAICEEHALTVNARNPLLGLSSAHFCMGNDAYQNSVTNQLRDMIVAEQEKNGRDVVPHVTVIHWGGSSGDAEHAVMVGPFIKPDDDEAFFSFMAEKGLKENMIPIGLMK